MIPCGSRGLSLQLAQLDAAVDIGVLRAQAVRDALHDPAGRIGLLDVLRDALLTIEDLLGHLRDHVGHLRALTLAILTKLVGILKLESQN